MSKILRLIFTLFLASAAATALAERLTDYVDPRIGSEGLGRVFIGPSHPFGMVKPSPDCTVSPNSGWLPMPQQVNGFAQVHVSGTGGGPKYGNISLMPFCGPLNSINHIDWRRDETIELGYYATTVTNSGIQVEITTAPRAAYYRITYPADSIKSLMIDAGFFLGESPVPDAREAQQFVGSEVEIVSNSEVRGYSRIRGGWNNGRAYTVYFCAITDSPAVATRTWRADSISDARAQYDGGVKTGALMQFAENAQQVNVRVGISFLSSLKARENALNSGKETFDATRADLLDQWEALLSRITIDPATPDSLKRMFYTGLYHTMLMPVDRTGENPLWTDPVPYYDDFYAIWDTYRSSSPLITLIAPQRQADMVNSLINIAKRDGYMPDARSGNANGRTQGGSNAEIVLADAFVKHLPGIDWEEALKAMLVDATQAPGGNQEAEGRGGLDEYLRLGYIPHGIPRAGNRTVEYAYNDYAIYLVAKGLGHDELAEKYLRQSANWKNLWRADYEHDGARGFIMPRDADGNWLDDIPFGDASRSPRRTFRYTPVTFEGPWYTPWWSMFFYEASSWEYSLSIPHDVEGLIEACGGPEAFEKRLDTFFDRPYFNVNNEPSFLSPCLYHWLGRPDRSSDRILEIIAQSYSDSPAGLPGNDDSGAMSSWLAFHLTGLYPNAGQDYYLIHTPVLKSATYTIDDAGTTFTISAPGLSADNRYIVGATLNGQPWPYSTISHARLARGGVLELEMADHPAGWGKKMFEK